MNIPEHLLLLEKNLATQWPLFALVAINPLSDLTDLPFESAIATVAEHLPITAMMDLSYYHRLFRLGKIQAEMLAEVLKTGPEGLAKLMLDQNFQVQLENFEATRKYQVKNKAKLLLSEQMKLYLKFDLTAKIRNKLLKWLMAYFDQGQSTWKMPANADNLFLNWKRLAAFESKALKSVIGKLSDKQDEALAYLIDQLQLPEIILQNYFQQIIRQLYGWASFIKWLQQRPNNPLVKQKAEIITLLVIWLSYELVYLRQYQNRITKDFAFNVEIEPELNLSDFKSYLLANHVEILEGISTQLGEVKLKTLYFSWQSAYELQYQQDFFRQFYQRTMTSTVQKPVSAQAIFCIDTRSEGFRRHLENIGPYQTFGFAGFFGFAFKLDNMMAEKTCLQYPAYSNLLEPQDDLIQLLPQLH